MERGRGGEGNKERRIMRKGRGKQRQPERERGEAMPLLLGSRRRIRISAKGGG